MAYVLKDFHKVCQSFARNEVKMLQIERFKQIREPLEKTPTLRIGQIAQVLYVSEATVRRDVDAMEKNGFKHRLADLLSSCRDSRDTKQFAGLFRLIPRLKKPTKKRHPIGCLF